MEGSETYNHLKDVRPRSDASKQCLSKMHRRDNAHTPFFNKILIILGANGTPSHIPMAPPPRKKNYAPPPPGNAPPPSGKKNLGPGH